MLTRCKQREKVAKRQGVSRPEAKGETSLLPHGNAPGEGNEKNRDTATIETKPTRARVENNREREASEKEESKTDTNIRRWKTRRGSLLGYPSDPHNARTRMRAGFACPPGQLRPGQTTGDEHINVDATHVGGARSRGKMSVRSTASAGEESQAEKQRKADREARLKSKVKQPRDDDDDDDVMN